MKSYDITIINSRSLKCNSGPAPGLATAEDLDRLVAMSDQAKESFKAKNIDQWQKGEPNRQVMEASILRSQLHVLEDTGQVVGMITIVPGPEASYASIDGAWLNQEPYFAFHRICVEESMKGRGLAARLFSEAEQYVLKTGVRKIRIDTHPDNQAMQRALAKSGYICCGTLVLTEGSEAGDLRVGYQKVI